MKKDLIIVPNENLGGAEQVLQMLSFERSHNTNVEIFFLTKTMGKPWINNKNNIKYNYSRFNYSILGLFQLAFYLNKQKKFNYVFSSHTFVNGFVGILIKFNLFKVNYFIARESTEVFKRFKGTKLLIYKILIYLGYSNIDLLISQTKKMEELLKIKLLSHPKILKTIPNPVNFKNIKVCSNEFIVEDKFLVSAGRLIPEKGYDNLIHAFNNFRLHHPEIKLIILGDGPEKENLLKLIVSLNLVGSVILKGFVNNVYPYFKKAKICIVSSRIEGFPNVLLQMMSQNTKVISTLCAGGIKDLKGVFTLEVDDIKGLSSMMTNVLKKDTLKNRVIFDILLKKRDINVFMKNIDDSIKKNQKT